MFCLEETQLRNHMKPMIQSFEYDRRVNCENKKERKVGDNAMWLPIFILPRKTFILVHFKPGPYVMDLLSHFRKHDLSFPSCFLSPLSLNLNLTASYRHLISHVDQGSDVTPVRWAAVTLTGGGREVQASWKEFGPAAPVQGCSWSCLTNLGVVLKPTARLPETTVGASTLWWAPHVDLPRVWRRDDEIQLVGIKGEVHVLTWRAEDAVALVNHSQFLV